MKKLNTLVAVAFGASVFVAAPVFADGCMENVPCFQSLGNEVQVGGTSEFSGFGLGVFDADQGYVDVDKSGFAVSESEISLSGSGLRHTHAGGETSFAGAAGEMLTVQTGAYSAGEGADSASTFNMGEANSGVTFRRTNVGGTSEFSGYGAGEFVADQGSVLVEKSGYGMNETTLSVDGQIGQRPTSSFTFNGAAGEMVSVSAEAFGTTSGAPVMVSNEGAANSSVSFDIDKLRDCRD